MFRSLSAAFGVALLVTPTLAAEVNVYSYRQPELIDPLTDAFTARTGIVVNTVFLSKGMLERLEAEGRRSPADLVFTTDISNLTALADAGLTQPVVTPTLTAKVPETLRAEDGQWYGLTARARVIYASKERVADGDVTTYEALADPKWRGRICTRSGAHSYNLALTSAVIGHHGLEGARAWLAGLKANLARKPQGNDRAQVKAIWAGECDIAIGNTYYMAAMLRDDEQKAWADSVRIVFPTFENGGAHMNISGMAMTRHAPNRESALALMEFLASAEGQKIYADINAEYPVLDSVPASDLVESWGTFTRDTLPLSTIAKHTNDALRLVETVGFDN